MRSHTLFAGILALAGSCKAIEAVEAAKVLYYYTVYDLDSRMWGTGYVAPKCKGTRDDGKCTFDEFVNYIKTGDASASPSYYTVESGFSFFAGDIMAMITALMKIDAIPANHIPRLMQGRTTAQGLFDDLAHVIDEDHQRADSKQIGITRHKNNIQQALGGLRAHLSAKAEGGLAARLQNWNRDVVWKIVQRENAYVKDQWKKVDWQATVLANPELKNPKSNLYMNTVKTIKGEKNLVGNLQDRTMAIKAAETFNQCYKT